jgi:Malectin domain/Glycosyl hydrolase family 81 C-terminal domain/Putative Ig domain/Malectin-like domain
MYDSQFLANYGPMMKMIVKSYGNYDRTDTTEPFLRQFDIWEGHNNAGGTGSPNGENEESSSEGIQGFGGMFLLGSAMNDSQMQAAGAMGFAMESCAINEYWQDIYQTNFPSSYNRAGNGQVWSSGLSYGTFFSGDPAWVYAIQYCPANHWLNYMTRYNTSTVIAKYNAMWTERLNWCNSQPAWTSSSTYAPNAWVSYQSHVYSNGANTIPAGGAAPSVDTTNWSLQGDCSDSQPSVLGDSPGHVMLCYQALFEHDAAAAEFDNYWNTGNAIATSAGDAGSSYYLIHGMRCIGDQDFNSWTSMPTSAVYVNAATGVRNYVVYNPLSTTQSAVVYNNGAASGTMTVPAYVTVKTTNANFVATAPAAPTGLTGAALYGQISLNWTPANYAASYNVKRATTSGGPFTTIGTSPTVSYTDSTGTPGTTYYYVVSAVNSVGEGASSTAVAVPMPQMPLLAVNCGGTAAGYFVADNYYSAGTVSTTATTISTSGVTNPAPQTIYQSNRYGALTYTLPGFTAGTTYNVRLHFAETYYTTTGSRKFNVIISGTQVLTNFDIVAAAGGGFMANVQSFNVPANSGGQIVIQLVNVTDNAQINGIEVYGTGSGGAVPAITSSLSATGTAGSAFNYQITASNSPTSYGATGLPAGLSVNAASGAVTGTPSAGGTSNVTIKAINSSGTGSATLVLGVQPAPSGTGTIALAVNCGGTASGSFVADNYYTGGTPTTTTGTITTTGVTNPAPAAVYQSNRYGAFSYTLPGLTANTAYTVRLHFAETYWTAAGKRVFNVSINGTSALANFDIYAAAGAANKAYVQSFTATANASGQIVIATTNVTDNAQINGIEIDAAAASSPSIAVAVNSGGTASGSFVADNYYTGGTPTTTTGTITTTGVTNPAPAAVYQSNRYGAFSYTIPGLTANTAYTVRLHFAETYWTAAGKRVFNVSINGTQVLANFDIYGAAGAANKANVQSFSATSNASGQIVIATTNVTDNAQINGVEIDH